MEREEKKGARDMNPTSNYGKAVYGGKIAKTVVLRSHWVFDYVGMDTVACSYIAGIFGSCFKSPPRHFLPKTPTA